MSAATTPAGAGRELFRPESALWWLGWAVGIGGLVGVTIDFAADVQATQAALWALSPLFIAITAAVVAVLLALDPYRSRRVWPLMTATLLGGSAAAWVSSMANDGMRTIVTALLDDATATAWSAAINGPFTEEWSKAACILLVMVLAARTLTRPMHALLVGAFVGLGFQTVENLIYAGQGATSNANSDLAGALSITLLRVLGGVTTHTVFSALAGLGIAVLLGRVVGDAPWSRARRVGGALGLLALAWGLHALWNSPPVGPELLGTLIIPLKTVVVVAALALATRWAWRQERTWLTRAQTQAGTPADGARPADASPAVRAAIGTRRQRRAAIKVMRREAGLSAVCDLRRRRRAHLDTLQAWGRAGTGIDDAQWNPAASADRPMAVTTA